LITINLLKLRSAALRTAVMGKLSLEGPQPPFPWKSAEMLPYGERPKFAYTFLVADEAM